METKEMFGLVIGVIGVIGGLTIGAIAVYYAMLQDTKTKLALLEARNKERLALIEKGLDPLLADKKRAKDSNNPLLWGMLCCGIALGALIGYAISHFTGGNENILTNAMAVLFGGIGLILFYMISKGKRENKTG